MKAPRSDQYRGERASTRAWTFHTLSSLSCPMMRHLTVGHAVAQATTRLDAAGIDTARLDAQVLLCHALGVDRAWLLAHPEVTLSPAQATAFADLVAARASRQPVAYLTGHREFYGLDFCVTRAVLVPRPETEHLVERAVAVVRAWRARHHRWPRIVEVGVGSGAIVVSLAHSLPDLMVTGVDVSPDALAVTAANARRHHVADRVRLVEGDLLSPLTGTADLVLANLPYIPSAELDGLAPEVRAEPRLALDGGPDGLDVFRRLFAQVPSRVAPGGVLLLEMGAGQGAALLALATCLDPARVTVTPDLAGHDRLLEIELHDND